MLLCPVKESKLKLCHAAAQVRVIFAFAHLFCHLLADAIDTWVVLVLLIRYEQVKLRVLLNLYAEFIQALDRSVASEEVLWTWTECDDLQALQTEDDTCYWHEVLDHLGNILCCTYRVLRDIAFQVAHAEVVRAVEHTAISVTTTIDHVAITFCCCNKHHRTIEVLCNQSLWGLRTEVAEENNQGVTALQFLLLQWP